MIGEIFFIFATLMLSAYFSGMEIAFVSSNRMLIEVEKEKDGLTQRITGFFFSRPNDFVSTMLVGNNIALVVYGIFIARLFDSTIFAGLDGSITVPADTVLSTVIVLFTGEYLPKMLFKSAPNKWLNSLALPTFLFYVLLWPVSRLATLLSRMLLAMVGVKMEKKRTETENFSKVDLDYLVQQSIENAEDEEDIEPELELFQNALEFADVKVRDCMIPRTELYAVDINDCTNEQLLQKFVDSGHSKLIVYDDDIDHIVGYIHSSEMFANADKWREHIIKVPFVPETMGAHKFMRLLMQQKKSMGVVVDEFGGTGGIVSLEDIVEELFGEIEDEHDSSNLMAKKTADNEYDLSARMEIDSVNEMFDLELPESDDYMTIGGMILYHKQSFPKVNEVVKIQNYEFRIVKKTNTKIELVHLKVTL